MGLFTMINCRLNYAGDFNRLFEQYDAGYEEYRHCECHVCELTRAENNTAQCENNSCDGCKNLASGVKIRSWRKDMGEK